TRLFKSLRYIVVDEAHRYRGVFGSHVALILRRLLRIAVHYGAAPVVIGASATMAEPDAAFATLTGRHVPALTPRSPPRPPRGCPTPIRPSPTSPAATLLPCPPTPPRGPRAASPCGSPRSPPAGTGAAVWSKPPTSSPIRCAPVTDRSPSSPPVAAPRRWPRPCATSSGRSTNR